MGLWNTGHLPCSLGVHPTVSGSFCLRFRRWRVARQSGGEQSLKSKVWVTSILPWGEDRSLAKVPAGWQWGRLARESEAIGHSVPPGWAGNQSPRAECGQEIESGSLAKENKPFSSRLSSCTLRKINDSLVDSTGAGECATVHLSTWTCYGYVHRERHAQPSLRIQGAPVSLGYPSP